MFQCEQCPYNTKIKCNFIRHTKTCKKHPVPPENITQNNNVSPQNNNVVPQNNNVAPQNNNVRGANIFVVRCCKCSKPFARIDNLRRHELNCDGVHSLQCKTCLKMFTSQQGKYQHNKNVNCKPPTTIDQSPYMIIHNNDNRVDNSTNNHITNNITMNTNIVLNVHGKENYDALLDMIRTKYPQAFVTMVEEGDTASLLKLVHFNNDFPENQTIRKPAKKDVSAEVHMGEGRWEKRPTQEVIETFRGQTSKHLCESLETNIHPHEKHNDMYLKEILYEQSKIPSGNTESLFQPFMLNKQEISKKELIKKVYDIKIEMLSEYPSIKGTKMFINQWKREARPLLHAFEDKWNTFDVSESIQWE